MNLSEVGIVVPTIGQRSMYLLETLRSIRLAGDAYILLVGRNDLDLSHFRDEGLVDAYVDEIDPRLPNKINFAFEMLPAHVKYINWIGDDDVYEPGAISLALERMKCVDRPILVYGMCSYIDANGRELFSNKSGEWASKILRYGPNLIPQPGALYRRDAFIGVGGLSPRFSMAFDFDLWIKLSRHGGFAYIAHPLAKFRWHPNSLSVSRRKDSALQASLVRNSHRSPFINALLFFWELLLFSVTYFAGKFVTMRNATHHKWKTRDAQ